MGESNPSPPPFPAPSFPKRETCSSVFSTFQNTAAMQQSVQKQPGACQTCTDTARLSRSGGGEPSSMTVFVAAFCFVYE